MGLTRTEEALVGRACAVFGIPRVEHVDPGTSLFSWDGFVSRATIDSLAVVEFLIAVGDELGLDLLEIVDESETDTLGQLGQVIEDRAEPSSLERFDTRWGASPG